MAVRKIKDSWWIDLRVQGKRRRLKCPHNSRSAAHDYDALLRREVALHGTLDGLLAARAKPEPPLTFAAFAERWMREYVAVNNKPMEQYMKRTVLAKHLLPVFGHRPLAAIQASDIEQLKGILLAKRLKAKTANNYLTMLSRCLHTAVDWGLLAAAPRVTKLKTMRPPHRFLTEVEVQQLVSAAGETVWADLLLTVARTGLRRSEFIALEWQDIDFRTGLLTVQRGWVNGHTDTPKSSAIRHLPLTSDVFARLARRRRPSGPVFLHEGRPLRPAALARNLGQFAQVAGVRHLGWHVLRHTFASHLAQAGVPLQVIQELMGHSSIEMVLRYAHLAPQTYAVAIAALEHHVATNGHQVGTNPLWGGTSATVPSLSRVTFSAQ